jgi:lipopolysaccharide/colanic/teichoic acid biosynthesis glycosyltransferase
MTIHESTEHLIPSYKHVTVTDGSRASSEARLRVVYAGADLPRFTERFSNVEAVQVFSDLAQLSGWIVASPDPSVDAVILDMPYQKEGFIHLGTVVRSSTLSGIPFLFVDSGFSPQASELVGMGLIDDVIDHRHDGSALSLMVSVHGKLKRQDTGRHAWSNGSGESRNGLGLELSVKRAIDILISGTLIVLTAPLMALIALVIRLESKGPVTYVSPRAGRGYRVFPFYKFRTMRVGADRMMSMYSNLNQYQGNGQASFFKLQNDPRVTRVGAFLRKTSLDELPQLFNVLLGHMSVVGNRPLPLYEAMTLTTDDAIERFEGPAGITGLWQVEKRGKPSMSVEERIGLDIDYARHHNTWMDLKIICKTPFCILQETRS